MEMLNRVPLAAQPYFWPVLGAVITVMGFASIVSYNNPTLKAAIKEHVPWLIGGGILVFGGVAILTGFFGGLGIAH